MRLDFKEIKKLNNLPQFGSRVVVAMSGGVDSSVTQHYCTMQDMRC